MANQRETSVHTEMAQSAQDATVKASYPLLQKNIDFRRLAIEMWDMQSAILHDSHTSLSQNISVRGDSVTSAAIIPTTQWPACIESLMMQSTYLIKEGRIASLFIDENRWVIKHIPHGLLLFLHKIPQVSEQYAFGQYLQSLRVPHAQKVNVENQGTIFLGKNRMQFLGDITFPDTEIHRAYTSYLYALEYSPPPARGTRAINPQFIPSKTPSFTF